MVKVDGLLTIFPGFDVLNEEAAEEPGRERRQEADLQQTELPYDQDEEAQLKGDECDAGHLGGGPAGGLSTFSGLR